MGEWTLHPHEWGRGGVTLMGLAHAPWAAPPPLSYKRRRWRPLSPSNSSLSHMPFGWHLPPLASWSSFTSTVLRRSPTQDLFHHHHHVIVLLEFPRIRCFRCPTGARDGGRRRTGRVTDHGCAARLWRWSSRPWGRVCTLYTTHVCLRERYPASGLRGWVLLKPLQVIS